MVTYREVITSPSGWADLEETPPVKDFELALSELLGYYRHRTSRKSVIDALLGQAAWVGKDEGWTEPEEIRNEPPASEIPGEVNSRLGEPPAAA